MVFTLTRGRERISVEDARKEFLGIPFDKDVERRISATGYTFAVSIRSGRVSAIYEPIICSPLKRP